MSETAPPPARSLAVGLLLGLLGALYLLPALGTGWWEPGETSMVRLAEAMTLGEGGSIFASTLDGEAFHRPWLVVAATRMGWSLAPGAEWGIRLPGLLFLLLGSLSLMWTLWNHVGPRRAFLAALLVGATPLALVSAANAGGLAILLGSLALALATWINALLHPPCEKRWLLASLATGLTFWAGGAVALGSVLMTLGFVALALPARPERTSLAVGLVTAVLVCLGLLYLRATESSTAAHWVTGLIGIPASIALLAGPASHLRAWFTLRSTTLLFAVLAATVLLPLTLAVSGHGPAAFAQVWEHSASVSHSLTEPITFDVVLRLATFSFYPLAALVPLAFAWAWSRAVSSDEDPLHIAGLLPRLLLANVSATFLLFAVAAPISMQPMAPVTIGAMLVVVLALTDTGWLEELSRKPAVAGLAGLVSVFSLVMISRDVRGTHNMEIGRPGPQVIFEPFLLDGGQDFPGDYTFRMMTAFVLVWVILVLLATLEPHRRIAGVLHNWTASPARFRVVRALQAPLRWIHRPANAVARRIDKVLPLWPIALLISVVAWSAEVAVRDLPNIAESFTQASVYRTWERVRQDEPLHVTGVRTARQGWYLDEARTEALENLQAAADLMCDADRAFVALRTSDLSRLHQQVRSRVSEDRPCGDAGRPIVLTSAAHQYVLVSNRDVVPAGQTEDNPIAASLFTEDTLPEDVSRPETPWVADNRLRLVAHRISPNRLRRGYVTVDVWWEVLRPVTGDWEIFIHADTRGGRINGDHEPVGGSFPVQHWSVGEIVLDSYDLRVSSTSTRAGTYTVHYGFFRGDRRMTFAPEVADNRIPVGTFVVPQWSQWLRGR